jgi:outer membrane protein assembly factor BamB
MTAKPWYQNTAVLLIACLTLPPLGIILLWLRPGMGIFRKLIFSGALAAFFVGHLFWFYGMRMELDGSARLPMITFLDLQSHYGRLEDPSRRRVEPAGQPQPASPDSATESPQAAPAAAVAPGATEAGAPPLAKQPEGSSPVDSAPEASQAQRNAYWTDFRGPRRDGHYEQTPIRTAWPAGGLPEIWRQTVGGGYASMTVANGRVFTIEQRRGDEVVAAYDFQSGGELWTHSWPARFEESMGGPGPRATPTWHEGKVYALGATGELRVLEEASGTLVWKKNILSDGPDSNLPWAMSASPLIVDDKVIVQPGGSSGSIVAYNKLSGEPVWKVLSDTQSYTSPMEVTLVGRRQILAVSAHRMMGLAIEDGSLLWEFPWFTGGGGNISQPLVVDEQHVFISAGYGHGSALVKINSGDTLRAEEVWRNNSMKCKFNSPVLYQGHVYGLDDGILAAVDVWTGERDWKGGRYGFGQLLLAEGHLIVLTEGGDVALVKATPEAHQELARFEAIDGKTWNNPAIANGKLLVRNQTEMACYDLSAGGGS